MGGGEAGCALGAVDEGAAWTDAVASRQPSSIGQTRKIPLP